MERFEIEEHGILFQPCENIKVRTTNLEVFDFFKKFLYIISAWESDDISNHLALSLIDRYYTDMVLDFIEEEVKHED